MAAVEKTLSRFPEFKITYNNDLTQANAKLFNKEYIKKIRTDKKLENIIQDEVFSVNNVQTATKIGSGTYGTVYHIKKIEEAVSMVEYVFDNGIGAIYGFGNKTFKDFQVDYDPSNSYSSLIQSLRNAIRKNCVKNIKKESKKECMLAIKFQALKHFDDIEDCRHEAVVHSTLSNRKDTSEFVPPIYVSCTLPVYVSKDNNVINMRVTLMKFLGDGTTLNRAVKLPNIIKDRESRMALYKNIRRTFITLWANGIVHADAHDGNIMVNPTTLDITLLDFGFAIKLQESTRKECKKLLKYLNKGKTSTKLSQQMDKCLALVQNEAVQVLGKRYAYIDFTNMDNLLLKSVKLWVENPSIYKRIHSNLIVDKKTENDYIGKIKPELDKRDKAKVDYFDDFTL